MDYGIKVFTLNHSAITTKIQRYAVIEQKKSLTSKSIFFILPLQRYQVYNSMPHLKASWTGLTDCNKPFQNSFFFSKMNI